MRGLLEQDRESFGFDIDGNLFYTPDLVLIMERVAEGRRKVEVSQEVFDTLIIDGQTYDWVDGNPLHSFSNFLKRWQFLDSVRYCLVHDLLGPSQPDYKQALLAAAPLAEITARGQHANELRQGTEMYISEKFTKDERKQLVDNIQRRLGSSTEITDEKRLIDMYLRSNSYLPLHNEDTMRALHISPRDTLQTRKNIWFSSFVPRVHDILSSYYGDTFLNDPRYKVGFSDDTQVNIISLKNHIISDLKPKFPLVDFYLYPIVKGVKVAPHIL